MRDISACIDGTLKNPATADKSLSDFQWGSDLFVKGMCIKERVAMMLEHQPTSTQPEVDVLTFEPHFHIDLYPVKQIHKKEISI